MRLVNSLDHGFWDPKRTVSAPAEASARWFDDEDSRLVFEQAPYSVLTQAPTLCDMRDGEMLLQ